jgi:hypothetical protein
MRREPREIEPSLLKEKELKEKDEIGLLGVIKGVVKDVLLSTISKSLAHDTVDTPPVTVKNYTPDKFLNNWESDYWAGEWKEDPKDPNCDAACVRDRFMRGARSRMKAGTSFPKKRASVIKSAINKAVDIFGGDKGKDKSKRYSAARLRKDLINAGWVESNYATVVSDIPKNTDSGYWQVQPLTAWNLLRDAKAHFVIKDGTSKFEQEFGDYDDLLKLSRTELKERMRDEKDQRLAAAFAALKILTTFDQE